MGEGLAVNYSGGTGMPEDVRAWLKENSINQLPFRTQRLCAFL